MHKKAPQIYILGASCPKYYGDRQKDTIGFDLD